LNSGTRARSLEARLGREEKQGKKERVNSRFEKKGWASEELETISHRAPPAHPFHGFEVRGKKRKKGGINRRENSNPKKGSKKKKKKLGGLKP